MDVSQIVVVGGYNSDVSLSVARLPAPGETAISLGRLQSPGGKGSNQAIAAARAGAATAVIAAIGTDAAGDEAMALWSQAGVDSRGVVRLADCPTGMAMILVDAAAENVIVVEPGANARLSTAHVEAAAALVGCARLVLAQLESPVAATVRAFQIARAAGAATALNAAPAPEALDPALRGLTDILIVNEGEGERLSGQIGVEAIGRALLAGAQTAVVVTLGARGAMLFEPQREPFAVKAPKVEAVDTTGAGDAFAGAFAARWVAVGDLQSAVAWGAAAGALACTARGAARSFPDAAQIAALA